MSRLFSLDEFNQIFVVDKGDREHVLVLKMTDKRVDNMERVPLLQFEARPQSARPSRVSSSRKHTARSYRMCSARSDQSGLDDEDNSSLDLDMDDEEPWVMCLEEATSAVDGMRRLYDVDKQTFYTMGDTLYKYLQLRFEHQLGQRQA